MERQRGEGTEAPPHPGGREGVALAAGPPLGSASRGVDDKKGSHGPPPAGLPASLVRPCPWVTSPAPSLGRACPSPLAHIIGRRSRRTAGLGQGRGSHGLVRDTRGHATSSGGTPRHPRGGYVHRRVPKKASRRRGQDAGRCGGTHWTNGGREKMMSPQPRLRSRICAAILDCQPITLRQANTT